MTPHKYRENVYYCYNNSHDCVESDEVLLAFYEIYFGKLSHQGVSSVKRAGRYWRQRRSFIRSVGKRELDVKYSQEIKSAYEVSA